MLHLLGDHRCWSEFSALKAQEFLRREAEQRGKRLSIDAKIRAEIFEFGLHALASRK